MNSYVPLPHPRAKRIDAIAAQHAAAREKPPALPVRQAQFGPVERVLTVDPTGEPVANEGRVDGREESRLGRRILGDQGSDKTWAMLIEERHRFIEAIDDA